MQIKELEELIQLIERSEIEEFELERSGTKIKIRKARSDEDKRPIVVSAPLTPYTSAETGASPADTSPPAVETSPDLDESLYLFKAPIVGTCYLSSKPDAPPFVETGQQIQEGTVLCIIEAMKIFNQIESDIAGEVVRILVESGQPVEYGEALFELRLNA
jgi:acetyl-CoA carboxylase biotin carboxyl carrier protein